MPCNVLSTLLCSGRKPTHHLNLCVCHIQHLKSRRTVIMFFWSPFVFQLSLVFPEKAYHPQGHKNVDYAKYKK